jgi:leucyl-tRNA synthetase
VTLPYTDPGVLVNSGTFDSLNSEEAIAAIAAWMESEGFGDALSTSRLRDWLISRNASGGPIPIIHSQRAAKSPPEADLPVTLPALPDFRPRGDGRAPLANVPDFVATVCPAAAALPSARRTR